MKTALWSLFSVGLLGSFAGADTLGIKLTGNVPVSNVSVSGSQKNGDRKSTRLNSSH